MTLPFVPLKCINADPAWMYNQRMEFRKDNPEKKAKAGVGASGHYRLSPMDELLEMGGPIQMCSHRDCLLTLWCTGPILTSSMTGENIVGKVIAAWGFRAAFIETVWVKTQRSIDLVKRLKKQGLDVGETRQTIHLKEMIDGELSSTLFEKNMGFYVPGNCEIRIGCVRGKPIHENAGYKKPAQILECPESCQGIFEEDGEAMVAFHTQESPVLYHENLAHSEKPQATVARLEKWLGPFLKPGEFCELFARRVTPGWHCYGNEITGRLIYDDLMDHAKKIYSRGGL